MADRAAIATWALKKFGKSTLESMNPTLTELEQLYEYDRTHPGTTAGNLRSRAEDARRRGTAGDQSAGAGSVDPNVGAFQHPQSTDAKTMKAAADLAVQDPKTAPARAKAKKATETNTAAGTTAFQIERDNPDLAAALKGLPPEAITVDPKTGIASMNPDWGFAHQNDPRVIAYMDATHGAKDKTSAILADATDPKAKLWLDAPVSTHPNVAAFQHPGGAKTAADKMVQAGAVVQGTYGDQLVGLYKMDPDTIRALKKRLWAGGFYKGISNDPGIINTNKPDAATRAAYQIALQHAARLAEAGSQTTVDQVIAEGNPNPVDATGAAAIGPYNITNPADLKSALLSASQERLGRDLSDDEIKTFSKLYQGMESQYSQRYMAAGRNNQEIGVVAAPQPGTAAQDYLDQHFKAQEQGYGAVQRQFEFYDLLGGIH